MGRFSDKIKKAQSQKFIQHKTEKFFGVLINSFIVYVNELESQNQEPTPERIDAKINELENDWVEFCKQNSQFLHQNASQLLRSEIGRLVEEVKTRILAQEGGQGTPEISKN